MAYEKYRTIVDEVSYFKDYEPENLKNISEDIRKTIYRRYVIKCMVFQRDNFKCKNEGCIAPESPITLHHIKFQKNGGKDSLRNCATICKSCHKAYHCGKRSLTFDGRTYQVHHALFKPINWKEIKKISKQKRNEVKDQHGIQISWELIYILMRFLELDLDNDLEFDEDDEEVDTEAV